MKLNTKKDIFLGMIAVAIALLIISPASAFAISAKYHEGNPLYILPGEDKDIFFTLQNLGGAEDIDIKIGIQEGESLVKLSDATDLYTIPAGGKAIVNLNLDLPAKAKESDTYEVILSFTTVSKGQSGAMMLGTSILQRFNVIAGDGTLPPQPAVNWTLISVIAAIVVLTACTTIFLRRKKRKKKKN